MLKTILAAMPNLKKLAAIAALAVLCVSAAQAATKTVTLSVSGMDCPGCTVKVKAALTKVNGVEKVEVSFEKKEAVVTYDDAKTNVEELKEACKKAGFPATEKQR